MGITCDHPVTLGVWAGHCGGVGFPLASDFWPHGAVSKAYGVFNELEGRPRRAIFVVDGDGIVRYIDVHKRGEVPDEEEIFEALAQVPGA